MTRSQVVQIRQPPGFVRTSRCRAIWRRISREKGSRVRFFEHPLDPVTCFLEVMFAPGVDPTLILPFYANDLMTNSLAISSRDTWLPIVGPMFLVLWYGPVGQQINLALPIAEAALVERFGTSFDRGTP